MKIVEFFKEHKSGILMTFGTVTLVADVGLALRNGIRMKRKLRRLPRDASNLDKVKAVAPELAETVVLTGVSIACFWSGYKIVVTDLTKTARELAATAGTVAMLQNRVDAQNAVMKEKLSEEEYKEAQHQVKEEERKRAKPVENVVKPKDSPEGHEFRNEHTGQHLNTTCDWLDKKFAEWQRDMTSPDFDKNPRSDEWVPVDTLFVGYFGEESILATNELGFKRSDIKWLTLQYDYPSEANPRIDGAYIPYISFSLSKDPESMPDE